jgi:hypothetical protein
MTKPNEDEYTIIEYEITDKLIGALIAVGFLAAEDADDHAAIQAASERLFRLMADTTGSRRRAFSASQSPRLS